MKCLLLLVVVGLTVAVEWTPAKIAAVMNSTPVEVFIDYLEPDLKELVQSKRQLQSTNRQHFCCKVDNSEPQPILKSRMEIKYEKVSISVTTGYQGCGLWGLGKCKLDTTRYHQEVKYSHKYLINPLFQDCPTEHVVCCAQFHLVNGNCIHNDHLNKHVGTFEFLHGIGLVKPDDHSTNSAADNSSA